VLAICIALPLPAQGAMLATDGALGASAQRERVTRTLERADVQARLQALGVSADQVKARVGALSDDEVAQLAQRMDSLPAGGEIIGALVLIFIILLITDILGFTKVFPFTKPVR
jgi:hypothetical protein